jgi:hypothetical protein
MEPITLKLYAHIPSGAAWAFFVADEASGLLLPITRDEFTIRVSRGVVVLDCEIEIDLHPGYDKDKFLNLKFEGGHLVCEQGFLVLIEPAISFTDTRSGRESINCVIMLEGFSEKEAE